LRWQSNVGLLKKARFLFSSFDVLVIRKPIVREDSMDGVAQNLRFAFRQLRKAPGFTVTVVLTLALGIGATTAIFSLVEGVLLRPLPFKDADRLVLLGDHLGGGPNISVTAREIETYSKATGAFACVGGYITTSYELSSGAQPEQIDAARLTLTLFLRSALNRCSAESSPRRRRMPNSRSR
jgi:hypothetical protein